jgi:hypothetical protein
VGVTVRGLDTVTAELGAIEERIANPEPAIAAQAQSLVNFVHERFRTRTAPDGTPWPPLKLHTVQYRESSGELESSVYAVASGTTLRLGASAAHASYQNAARPFLPSDLDSGPAAEEGRELAEAIATYVTTGETG